MNPNFTSPGAPPSFGSFQTTTAQSTPTFGLGASTTTPSFGVPASTTGFSLGSTTFGTGASTFGTTPFGNLGKSTSPLTSTGFGGIGQTTATSGNVSFQLPPATGTTTGFNIPTTNATTAPSGFSFGATFLSTTSASTSLTNPVASVTASLPGFGLGQSLTSSTTAAAALGTTATGLQSTATATTAAPTLKLNPCATTNVSSSLGLTATATSTAAPTTTALSFGIGSASGGTTVATLTDNNGAKSSVNFAEMDDTIHKWTLELVELEQTFLNQMDQVRDWDRLLLSTGDKIVSMNESMQKVKLRQQQLDHELDFIVAQQRELVECLQPLEKEFADITVSDPERNSIYQRAENLNTQLQQVSEDLKGVIEHINERNKSQDTSDPIVQIGRILNAHMNSLQWVDQNTSVVQQMLDQIGKMRDIHRRDADSTQNL